MSDTLKKLLGIPDTQDVDSFLRGLQEPGCLVENLLENPDVDASAEEDLSKYSTEESREGFEEQVRGAIGFFLFARSADQGDPKEKRGTLDVYLSASDVKAFIQTAYDLPPQTLSQPLVLHRVGTSSYVFRQGAWALKLIKPRYWPNKTILLATDAYKDDHPGVATTDADGNNIFYSPTIRWSGERYIVMDFIEGSNLREHREANPPDFTNAAQTLRDVARITNGLCDALLAHARLKPPRHHLDLSPANIMIRERGKPYLQLIDFGVNYLLTERFRSAPPRRQTQIYFAPELEEDTTQGTIASDVYSFGVILLELLTTAKDSGRDVSRRLDSLWTRWPRLAVLIESMIDLKPCHRLFGYPRDASLYRVIKSQVADECQLAARLEEVRETKLPWPITAVVGRLKRLWALFTTARTLKGQNRSSGAREARGLFRWAVLTQTAEAVIVLLFLVYLVLDFEVLWWPDLKHVLQSVGVPVPKHGDWRRNLPGRLVGLSFGLLGARYYINIFSTISTKGLSKFDVTNCTMRLTAFSFAPPILWAMIYWPPDWPFCSAVGCAIVALNNKLSYRLADRAKEGPGATFKLPGSAVEDAFLTEFRSWGGSMAWYAGALAGIGILLRKALAFDEWLYAGIVAIFVNLINMYRVNCQRKAPLVSAGLARLVGRLRRERAKENGDRDPVWDVAADE